MVESCDSEDRASPRIGSGGSEGYTSLSCVSVGVSHADKGALSVPSVDLPGTTGPIRVSSVISTSSTTDDDTVLCLSDACLIKLSNKFTSSDILDVTEGLKISEDEAVPFLTNAEYPFIIAAILFDVSVVLSLSSEIKGYF